MLYYQPQKLAFNIVTDYNLPQDFDLYSLYHAFKNDFPKEFLVDENESLSVLYARMYYYLQDKNVFDYLYFEKGEIFLVYEQCELPHRLDLHDFYMEKDNPKIFKPLLFLLNKIVKKGMLLPSFVYEYNGAEEIFTSYVDEMQSDPEEDQESLKGTFEYRFLNEPQEELYEMERLVTNFSEEYTDEFILHSLKDTTWLQWAKNALLSIKDNFKVYDIVDVGIPDERIDPSHNFFMVWCDDSGLFTDVCDFFYQTTYNECWFAMNNVVVPLNDFNNKQKYIESFNRFCNLIKN
jgi:hypothetical protein